MRSHRWLLWSVVCSLCVIHVAPPAQAEALDLSRGVPLLEVSIRERQIPAILRETFAPTGPSEAVARRTGAQVVTLCQDVGELPAASDYVALVEDNVQQLVQALTGDV